MSNSSMENSIELTINPPHDTGVYLDADDTPTTSAPQSHIWSGYTVRPKSLDLGSPLSTHPGCRGRRRRGSDYATKHPTTAVLLVEVADSSLRYDRKIKGHRYAQAGIADYWILNLVDRQLEVYRRPGPDPDRIRDDFATPDVTIMPAEWPGFTAGPDPNTRIARRRPACLRVGRTPRPADRYPDLSKTQSAGDLLQSQLRSESPKHP